MFVTHVCFGSKADISQYSRHVRFTPNSDRESGLPQTVMSALRPQKRTCSPHKLMSALGQKRTFAPERNEPRDAPGPQKSQGAAAGSRSSAPTNLLLLLWIV